jgi:hypothetical protein
MMVRNMTAQSEINDRKEKANMRIIQRWCKHLGREESRTGCVRRGQCDANRPLPTTLIPTVAHGTSNKTWKSCSCSLKEITYDAVIKMPSKGHQIVFFFNIYDFIQSKFPVLSQMLLFHTSMWSGDCVLHVRCDNNHFISGNQRAGCNWTKLESMKEEARCEHMSRPLLMFTSDLARLSWTVWNEPNVCPHLYLLFTK